MRMLGLDLGSKTIGIAISDPLGIVATPLETFRFREGDLDAALQRVLRVVEDREIVRIALGLPKNMDGTIGFQGEYCERFRRMIEDKISIDVVMIDERLTTSQVSKLMIASDASRKSRQHAIDKLAATIILQSYLDRKINQEERK